MDFVERETGFFPLSIGTSLALEGLFGLHPDDPSQPTDLQTINRLWINVRTLIRNFYASMTAEQQRHTPISTVGAMLLEELSTLETVVAQHSQGGMRLTVYDADMKDVKWWMPHASFKEAKTERQLHYQSFENLLVKGLRESPDALPYALKSVGRKPETSHGVCAILTHYPHELFWRFSFDRLFLLESHTGKVKAPHQWASKLQGVSLDDHIPLTPLTIQLFGEGSIIAPQPKKMRDEVRRIAVSCRWTVVTTPEKVAQDIRQRGSSELRELTGRLASRL